MTSASHRPSEMRVAIVSALRPQREALKSLIEQSGPHVVGTANFNEFLRDQAKLKPDVLLVDLEHASDDELDRLSSLISRTGLPVLFNESPTVPSMPGPLRDDWANNLIGKLFELSQPELKRREFSLLDRPRYVQSTTFRTPRVLILSRSKTRRRVLELILINQGFNETRESDFSMQMAALKRGDYDVILVDEHNLGADEAVVFDALLAQKDIPVYLCNSSKIPTPVADRKIWGRQLAGQLIQVHRRNSPLPRSAAVARPLAETTTRPDHAHAGFAESAEKWGDRMADKLARLRSSIKSNHDDFIADRSSSVAGKRATGEHNQHKPGDSAQSVPAEARGPSIVEQVTAHIAETQAASRKIQSQIDAELRRDLKYLPPEKLATIHHASNDAFGAAHHDESSEVVVDKPAKADTRVAGLIDASNFEYLPGTPLPGDTTSSPNSPSNRARESEIERFFEFNKQLEKADERVMEKADERVMENARRAATAAKAKAKPARLTLIDDSVSNPFSRRTATPGITTRGPRIPSTGGKALRKKTAMKRIVSSLQDIRRLIPKIFN